MLPPRLATYSVNGSTRYGAVTDGGIVDLSARYARMRRNIRAIEVEADNIGMLRNGVIDEAP